MSGKKKKQHYVPQCYLEEWAIPDTHQVFAYDKQNQKERKSNILDVAEENYFYDIDLTKVIAESEKEKYGFSKDADLSKADDGQYIENMFSKEIEGNFKRLLENIIKTASKSQWEIQNCFFLSDENKFEFSYYLAIQHLRVKRVRNTISDVSDLIRQAFENVAPGFFEKYTAKKEELPFIHGTMICDDNAINALAQRLYSLKWILRINKTDTSFFTSDNPIGTIPHISHPYMSMTGLNSSGIEAYFPISPTVILLMYDGDYHKDIAPFDRRSVYIDNPEDVAMYNEQIVHNSTRCVFSNDGNFSIIQLMLEKNKDVFNFPSTVLHWGGKTYIPRHN